MSRWTGFRSFFFFFSTNLWIFSCFCRKVLRHVDFFNVNPLEFRSIHIIEKRTIYLLIRHIGYYYKCVVHERVWISRGKLKFIQIISQQRKTVRKKKKRYKISLQQLLFGFHFPRNCKSIAKRSLLLLQINLQAYGIWHFSKRLKKGIDPN